MMVNYMIYICICILRGIIAHYWAIAPLDTVVYYDEP